MSLVPRSLFSRLVLVLFAGLLIAQFAGLALHLMERGELLAQASGRQSAQRIADVVQLIDPMSPSERKTIERVLNAPPLRLSLDRPPLAPVKAEDELSVPATMLGTLLRNALADQREVMVQVAPAAASRRARGNDRRVRDEDSEVRPRGKGYGARGGYAFVAQVKLRDGALATFDTRLPEAAVSWPYRLLLSIGLLLLAVLLVSYIAVRWATRPLKTLADAADELGRNIHRAPISENGPVEVAHAARAFNTMQARLSAYVRERTQVLAAMSHDLKTPITRLRLRAELLEDAQLRAKFAGDLQELEHMVSAALDFLRGVETSEPMQPVDIMALLESLQADMQEIGGEVQIEGHTSVPYPGRAQALKRCIRNVLENAIKYGQRARIVIDDNSERLQLRILDDGPGIPAAELEKVFEPFYRLEASRNRDTGGTGLGLAIARSVAELHGGKVVLSNRAGGGVEATLTLPRHAL